MAAAAASRLLRRALTPAVARRRFSTAAVAAETPPSPLPSATGEEDAGMVSMKGVRISGRPLYLDMQATTPVDPRVLDAMLPFYLSRFGNPHSR
ncbi:hypothetical protein GW17_00027740, partial [Ensete ventricosum]